MNNPDALTSQIADYVAQASIRDIPQAISHEGLRAFLNWLGCAIGGASEEAVLIAERALAPFSGPAEATLIGHHRKYDIFLASLLNCASSSALSFDDTHAQSTVHPTGPVAAPLLALAQRSRVTGSDFLLALIMGIEIQCRLSKAVSVSPARANIAWYQTSIAGGIGAAVATAKLLSLSPSQIADAIGIAASQAAGIRAMHGTMCTPLMGGNAARSGLQAALLAAQGFTSSRNAIEGRYGFVDVFAEVPDLDALTANLGRDFEIAALTYKPYPCGIVIHPIIDACLDLRREESIDTESIERVSIKASSTAMALASRRHPQTTLDGPVSLYHWAAAALHWGSASLTEGTLEKLVDPVIAGLRNRIEAKADPGLANDQADVSVVLKNGRTLHRHVEHCIGSRTNPMSDKALEDKFRGQAVAVCGTDRTEQLISWSWLLATNENPGELAQSAAPIH